MLALPLLSLAACTPRGLTQGGHTLELVETRTRRPGYGTRHGVDALLDGEPLGLTHWYAPVSPPMEHSPRVFYWGAGTSRETWEWELWQVFQVTPSSPEQYTAAREFLDAGTGPLFSALQDTDAYEWSYARQVFVLWQEGPSDLVFTSASGDAFQVTDSGAVFMDGALIGRLQVQEGRVTGLEIDLTPHTVGSGPGETQINPKEQDLLGYHLPDGADVFTTYGLSKP